MLTVWYGQKRCYKAACKIKKTIQWGTPFVLLIHLLMSKCSIENEQYKKMLRIQSKEQIMSKPNSSCNSWLVCNYSSSIKAHTCLHSAVPIHRPGLVRHGHQPSYWLGCSSKFQRLKVDDTRCWFCRSPAHITDGRPLTRADFYY